MLLPWLATSPVITDTYIDTKATNAAILVMSGHKNPLRSLAKHSTDSLSQRSDLGNKSDMPAVLTKTGPIRERTPTLAAA